VIPADVLIERAGARFDVEPERVRNGNDRLSVRARVWVYRQLARRGWSHAAIGLYFNRDRSRVTRGLRRRTRRKR